MRAIVERVSVEDACGRVGTRGVSRMKEMRSILWKEMRIFSHERGRLIVFCLFVTAATVCLSLAAQAISPLSAALVSSLAATYYLSWVSFHAERFGGMISYLLASPIDVGVLLVGKVIAISIGSAIAELAAVAIAFLTLLFSGGGLPSAEVLLVLLIAIPLWSAILGEILVLVYTYTRGVFAAQFLGIVLVTTGINSAEVRSILTFLLATRISIPGSAALVLLLGYVICRTSKQRIQRALS